MKLACRDYQVDVSINSPVIVRATFIVMTTDNKLASYKVTEGVSKAMAEIALVLGGHGIDLVFADPKKPRCIHCGSLNEVKVNQCSQCGAPL